MGGSHVTAVQSNTGPPKVVAFLPLLDSLFLFFQVMAINFCKYFLPKFLMVRLLLAFLFLFSFLYFWSYLSLCFPLIKTDLHSLNRNQLTPGQM